MKQLRGGSKAMGLFNRGAAARDIELAWSNVGLTGKEKLRDLWSRKDVGIMKERYTVRVPSHGAVLLRACNTNE